MENEKEIIEEFRDKLSRTQEPVYNKNVENFILKALEKQKSDLAKEIEGIFIKEIEGKGDYEEGFNQAIDDILEILKEK